MDLEEKYIKALESIIIAKDTIIAKDAIIRELEKKIVEYEKKERLNSSGKIICFSYFFNFKSNCFFFFF